MLCSIFLQSCSTLAGVVFFTDNPPNIYDAKLVSVTKVQLKPDIPRYDLQITFSSKTNLAEMQKKYGVTVSRDAFFCSDRHNKLQGWSIIVSNEQVIHKEQQLIKNSEDEFLYSAYVSLQSLGVSRKLDTTENYPIYDLSTSPADFCIKVRGGIMMLSYESNWITIPETMILSALLLPPDKEKSEVYRKIFNR